MFKFSLVLLALAELAFAQMSMAQAVQDSQLCPRRIFGYVKPTAPTYLSADRCQTIRYTDSRRSVAERYDLIGRGQRILSKACTAADGLSYSEQMVPLQCIDRVASADMWGRVSDIYVEGTCLLRLRNDEICDSALAMDMGFFSEDFSR